MTARLQGNRERDSERCAGLLGGEGESRQVGEIETSMYLCHLLFCLFALLRPTAKLLPAKRLRVGEKKFSYLD